jgi:hypothetical protein
MQRAVFGRAGGHNPAAHRTMFYFTNALQNRLVLLCLLVGFAILSAAVIFDAGEHPFTSVSAGRKLLDQAGRVPSQLRRLQGALGRSMASARRHRAAGAAQHVRTHRVTPKWEEELVLLDGVPRRHLLESGAVGGATTHWIAAEVGPELAVAEADWQLLGTRGGQLEHRTLSDSQAAGRRKILSGDSSSSEGKLQVPKVYRPAARK